MMYDVDMYLMRREGDRVKPQHRVVCRVIRAGSTATAPRRIPADLWLRFCRVDARDDAAVWAFCSDWQVLARGPLTASPSRFRLVYRELQPIVAAILHGQRLTEAQWGVLNHWSAQSVPQFRERQLGGSGEPPAVEVARRMITRDPFVLRRSADRRTLCGAAGRDAKRPEHRGLRGMSHLPEALLRPRTPRTAL